VHYTTGAQAVEVEVDMDMGKVEVIKAVAAFDMGKAINPDLVKAQMEGGFVQGMSTALFEAILLKDGKMRNPSFVDYRIATSADAPHEVEAIIVEVPQDDGPWGARGIGEHALCRPSRQLRMRSSMRLACGPASRRICRRRCIWRCSMREW